MIKMLHFADFHLGMENYGRADARTGINSRISDFLRSLDQMIGYALQQQVDLVVFAGDAFKNRQPNPTIQNEFASRITELSAVCPVVMLVGNHDLPPTEKRASSIEIYQTLQVHNVLVGQDFGLHTVNTRAGEVIVGLAPYPMRQQLLSDDAVQGKSISEIDGVLQASVHAALNKLARQAEAAAPHSAPRILAGHFTVTGAQLGSERGVMVGRDLTVGLGELDDSAWDYVALGHIHKHQNLTAGRQGATPVVYSGSLERIDFGEAGEPKGFCWVELGRRQTRWQFVQLNSRPFVNVRIDVRDTPDPMSKVLAAIANQQLEDAVVKVLIQADQDSELLLQDRAIYAALRDAKVDQIAAVIKDVKREARVRLTANSEGLKPIELLERYFVARNVPEDRLDQLLKIAESFLQDQQG
jgi:DNA repair protein SbcD/Mre11